MKRGLLLMVIVLLSASVAFAQLPGGAVGVYADELGTSCNFVDGPLFTFYMYHLSSPGATAVEFQLDITGVPVGMHLGDVTPFLLKQGAFADGTSIAYQACLSNNVYLGAANYISAGPAPVCLAIHIIAHPIPSVSGATTPLAYSCASEFMETSGSMGTFNNDGSCLCTGSTPVNESSWGQIKSLYN